MKGLYLAAAVGAALTAMSILTRGADPPMAILAVMGVLAAAGFIHGLVVGLGRSADGRPDGSTASWATLFGRPSSGWAVAAAVTAVVAWILIILP